MEVSFYVKALFITTFVGTKTTWIAFLQLPSAFPPTSFNKITLFRRYCYFYMQPSC